MFSDVSTLLLGATANLAAALLIVRGIYYPRTPERNYVFSFLAFNTVIFFVLGIFVLSRVDLDEGRKAALEEDATLHAVAAGETP